jgi:hypothetical protein
VGFLFVDPMNTADDAFRKVTLEERSAAKPPLEASARGLGEATMLHDIHLTPQKIFQILL